MPDKTRQHLLELLLKHVAVLPFRPLTVAEERVANLCAEGLSYKQIGHRLSMSPRTVQHHISTVASLLPEDGLPAQQRVQVWATCRALPALFERTKPGRVVSKILPSPSESESDPPQRKRLSTSA